MQLWKLLHLTLYCSWMNGNCVGGNDCAWYFITAKSLVFTAVEMVADYTLFHPSQLWPQCWLWLQNFIVAESDGDRSGWKDYFISSKSWVTAVVDMIANYTIFESGGNNCTSYYIAAKLVVITMVEMIAHILFQPNQWWLQWWTCLQIILSCSRIKWWPQWCKWL